MKRLAVLLIVVALVALLNACTSAPTTAPTLPVPTATATTAVEPDESPTATSAPTATALPDTPAPTDEPAAPSTPDAEPFAPRVEVVASELSVPWSLAFAPDGRLFFTERLGQLRVIVNGVLEPEPLAEFSVAAAGEGGLLGIALDPDFGANRLLYAMYTYRDGSQTWNRVSRYPVQPDGLGPEEVLLDRIPGAQFHDGGRIAFGPDGKLYVTTGDARNGDLAQDPASLAGKILRLNADGTVPTDNPYPDRLVYSLGHRNPQGLSWHPDTDALYSTEHGPSGEQGLCCRDELNYIEAGGNFGWPIVTALAGDARFVDPILYSGDNNTWAPASVLVYSGDALAPWRGNIFFGALRGEHLHRVVLAEDGRTVQEHEELYLDEYGRIRDVVQGPDGYIYFTTSNRDGRASPAAEDDRILRIVPR